MMMSAISEQTRSSWSMSSSRTQGRPTTRSWLGFYEVDGVLVGYRPARQDEADEGGPRQPHFFSHPVDTGKQLLVNGEDHSCQGTSDDVGMISYWLEVAVTEQMWVSLNNERENVWRRVS